MNARRNESPLAREIRQALEEGLAHVRGEVELNTTSMSLPAASEFKGTRLVALRKNLGIGRAELARFVNVTERTVAAWESGKRSPSGPALRMLQLATRPRP